MESLKELRLGKIYQKFIILDIIKCSDYLDQTFDFLHALSKSGRRYLKLNYYYITNNLLNEDYAYFHSYDLCVHLYLKYSEKYLNFSLI